MHYPSSPLRSLNSVKRHLHAHDFTVGKEAHSELSPHEACSILRPVRNQGENRPQPEKY